MKTKAVLFDLDDTLIDFVGFKRKAVSAAARAMVSAGLRTDSGKLANRLLKFYYSYGIESDDAFERFLLAEFGRAEPRIVAAGVNAYLKEKYAHLKPYPGVVETLRRLKKRGLKLAVVSDGLRLKAWMRLNAAGLDKYFDAVVTFEDTGKKKPHKAPFLKACKTLKVKPKECIMVGDWVERDIEGAKALGMRTCWAKYGSNAFAGSADCEINNISEILNLVAG